MNDKGINFLVLAQVNGHCDGVVTDGDFRRALISDPTLSLDQTIISIARKDFKWRPIDAETFHKFDEKINFYPVLDASNRVKGIIAPRRDYIEIEGRKIGKNFNTFIIAEIGNNHNGDYCLAQEMVASAAAAGVDCIKFQMRDMDTLYSDHADGQVAYDLGTEYTLDILKKSQLQTEELFQLFEHCRKLGVVPLCTPWDEKSLAKLERYGLQGYKIASADLTNTPLLRSAADTNKPLIVSTGMSLDDEIDAATAVLDDHLAEYILLQCNSTYPAPYQDVNLAYMTKLSRYGLGLVGYSGHERGYHVPIAAVALGAKVVEKHFTFDREMQGNDHKVSLLPDELARMVRQIREVEDSIGVLETRKVSQGELINRENLAKSLYYRHDIKVGEILSEANIQIRSPGIGIQPSKLSSILGKAVAVPCSRGSAIQWDHFEQPCNKQQVISFESSWGLPVRYHDMKDTLEAISPKIIEIHLSYSDIGRAIPEINAELEEIIVHAPELFEADHILDLTSEAGPYLTTSVSNFHRTIEETLRIAESLRIKAPTKIVYNAGGATDDSFLNMFDRRNRYENLARNLENFHQYSNVELIPQTMPPYPWHFGGQRFHNIFVDPNEINEWIKQHKVRICLDTSHTKLACNHLNSNYYDAIKLLLPHTAHLHISDAKGLDGEGLQIGEGEINWVEFSHAVENFADTKLTWIPEIWQGHTNKNNGARLALNKLMGVMK
jgi:N-acetylneuraminate synthase